MPSSSLFLSSGTTLALIWSLLLSVAASTNPYVLDTSYSGSTFFNGWNFFTSADPTHGFVTYVSQSTAQSSGLIKAGSPTYIGVDHTNKYNGSAPYYGINGVGRPSVRISTQKTWTHGLFIADIAHMPGGICGTWPAFWTLGPNWPYTGEIDIVEGANAVNYDLSSLHTGNTCTISSSGFSGSLQTTDCDYNNPSDNGVGCGIEDLSTNSYGSGFNSNGGGVYAMLWQSSGIQMWFFPRGSIPSGITNGAPNPANWGTPYASFSGPSCNIDSNFANHSIVIDNTFCGDFAGATWGNGCSSSTGQSSCSVYVGSNPSAFTNAYWNFNSVKVYVANSKAAVPAVATQATNSSSSSTWTSTTTSSSTSSTSTWTSTTSSTSTTLTTSSTKTTSTSTTPTTSTTSSSSSSTSTTSSYAGHKRENHIHRHAAVHHHH